jgi:hypothetical protein
MPLGGKEAMQKIYCDFEQAFIDSCGSEKHVNILSSAREGNGCVYC